MFKFLSPIFKRNKTLGVSPQHKALMESIMAQLNQLDEDTKLMKLELVILTATGRWLDSWGEWFGILRTEGEEDEYYSKRIVATTVKPKSTIPALISAVDEVASYTGDQTSIFEPHKFIARHNMSKFSGTDRYTDGVYWRSGVIDLLLPYDITVDIRNTVESVKAAGIRATFTQLNNIIIPDGEDGWTYGEMFIPYEDYTLIFEPALAIALKGAVFSMNTQGQRTRSGKQTLWGTYMDFGFEPLMLRNFERYAGESMVINRDDFSVFTPVPTRIGSKYSGRQMGGVVSGGLLNQYIETNTFDPTAKTDRQGDIVHTVYNLRPATRSHHGVYSGRFGFSGAPDDGWVDKPYYIVCNDEAVFLYTTAKRVFQETNLITELMLDKANTFNKSYRSGRQILFASDLLTLQTDLTMSKQKRELTFNDPYRWVDFLHALRAKDEELIKELINLDKLETPLEELFEYDSSITVKEIEDWGINIQKHKEVSLSFEMTSGYEEKAQGEVEVKLLA